MADIQFIESKRGQPIILYAGYQFNLVRKNKNDTRKWSCKDRKCSGSLTTDMENKVITEKDHSCVPNLARNEVEKQLFVCKKRVREEELPVTQIFNQTMMPLMDAGYEFVTEMPNIHSKKTTLYRQRHKAHGVTTFHRRNEIVLPDELTKDFLLVDIGKEDRILGFISPYAKEILATTEDFFADGTFKSCCRNFNQLYTIHGDIGSTSETTNIVPLIYTLLPDRQEKTYIRLFNEILRNIPLWSPKTIKLDFETTAINAFRNCFPNAIIRGCNFHFNQCIWRQVQHLGLTNLYREDEEIRTHVRMCAALSHLPSSATDDGWLFIMEHAPHNEKLSLFNDYFVNQWLQNGIIQEMWICNGERHRTTNAVEGWHSRLNKHIGKAHPPTLQIIRALREESKLYDFKMKQIDLGSTPRKRSKKYVQLDDNIRNIVMKYENNKITVGECLKKLSYNLKL